MANYLYYNKKLVVPETPVTTSSQLAQLLGIQSASGINFIYETTYGAPIISWIDDLGFLISNITIGDLVYKPQAIKAYVSTSKEPASFRYKSFNVTNEWGYVTIPGNQFMALNGMEVVYVTDIHQAYRWDDGKQIQMYLNASDDIASGQTVQIGDVAYDAFKNCTLFRYGVNDKALQVVTAIKTPGVERDNGIYQGISERDRTEYWHANAADYPQIIYSTFERDNEVQNHVFERLDIYTIKIDDNTYHINPEFYDVVVYRYHADSSIIQGQPGGQRITLNSGSVGVYEWRNTPYIYTNLPIVESSIYLDTFLIPNVLNSITLYTDLDSSIPGKVLDIDDPIRRFETYGSNTITIQGHTIPTTSSDDSVYRILHMTDGKSTPIQCRISGITFTHDGTPYVPTPKISNSELISCFAGFHSSAYEQTAYELMDIFSRVNLSAGLASIITSSGYQNFQEISSMQYNQGFINYGSGWSPSTQQKVKTPTGVLRQNSFNYLANSYANVSIDDRIYIDSSKYGYVIALVPKAQ